MATTTQIGTTFGESPVISADGNYVAFTDAIDTFTNAPSGTGSKVLIENLTTKQLFFVSVSSNGVLANGSSSPFESPAISANGRFVAFASKATNLVPGDTNGEPDLFLRDTLAGTTTRISLDANGTQLPANSSQDTFRPSISADGRYVAFQSTAALTGAGAPGGGLLDGNIGSNIFLRDTVAGTTSIVSANSSGVRVSGSSPSISADGRYIAFQSQADNLIGNKPEFDTGFNVFVYDRLTRTTKLASADVSKQTTGNGDSKDPVMSPDGRSVVFTSTASNLVLNDTNGVADIFKYDLQSGTTTRISVDSSGNQANGASGIGFGKAAVSGDGRYVVFASAANNLVPQDTNNATDVFVRDTVANTTTRVSVNSNGEEPVGGYLGTESYDGSISADGGKIVFISNGKNMNAAGIDGHYIYLRDLGSSGSNSPSVPTSTGASTSSQPDILIGLGKETLVGTSGVNYFSFQTRNASTLRATTRLENFDQPDGDRLVLGFLPKALYNVGRIRADNLLNAAQTAYQDKNKKKTGNQALKQNEAVLFKYRSNSYLSVNNRRGGFFLPKSDLLVNLAAPVLALGDNQPGVLSVSKYFT
jgi:Tol biopolymer transport system component